MTPEQEEELNHAMYAYGTARVMAKADTLPEYEVVRALVERFIQEARPKWIDVRERLPEFGEWILAQYSDRSRCLCQCVEGCPDDEGRVTLDYRDDEGLVDDELIAWMPLPELPKEGEK
jgi:hypothetical protein